MQLRSACAHYKRQEEELKEKVKEAEEVKKQNNEKDAMIEELQRKLHEIKEDK